MTSIDSRLENENSLILAMPSYVWRASGGMGKKVAELVLAFVVSWNGKILFTGPMVAQCQGQSLICKISIRT